MVNPLFKFGVSTMVYLALTPSKAVERILLKGFKSVELSYDSFLSSKVGELSELGKVVDEASKYTLESFSVHLPYDSLELGEPGISKAIARFSKWIKALDRLGVTFYVTHLPRLPPSKSSVDLAVRYLKNLVDLLGSGSQVLVENIANTAQLGATPEDLLEVMRRVDTPKLGVCVDVGHATIARIPLREYSSLLGSSVRSVHVHDNDGFSDKHMLPGTGVLGVSELAGFLSDVKPFLVVAEVACAGLRECDNVLNSIRDFESVLRNLALG